MEVIPEIGSTVFIRQRQYIVEEVQFPKDKDSCHVVSLTCIEDDAQGQTLKVLWEKEHDKIANYGEDWSNLSNRTFDDPKIFSAYYHNLNWNSITSTDPELFQAPFRSGIKIEPYQLEPLYKALKLPRVNLFIADDVGLGKTIEAGLIARELLIRKKVKDIVVFAPPSMLYQWKEELENRFGLIFEIMDKKYIAKVRQERGWAVNPWETHSRFLVSHRMLIDDEFSSMLREWLTEFRGRSLMILDEAHHAAPASDGLYAVESQFTKAIRDLAPRFEHRLFLSATPHNGHSNSFSALLEILDPNRFYRGEKIDNKAMIEDVMIRRLKEDLRDIVSGFPLRKVIAIQINEEDWAEIKLSKYLQEYKEAKEERMKDAKAKSKASAGLILIGLQQRLLSSPEAFCKTLRVHKKSFESGIKDQKKNKSFDLESYKQITAGIDQDSDLAELDNVGIEKIEDNLIEDLTLFSNEDIEETKLEREKKILDKMMILADKTRYQKDGKITYLLKWVEDNIFLEKKKWSDLRVIIFTEYEDTKNYINEQLKSYFNDPHDYEDRVAVFHGPTSMDKREEIKRAFNENPSKNKLRILITTDAAREGLNLQTHCWNLFHYDIPWNPGRLEQRNGRIDRKLQPNPEVYCRYFEYKHRTEDKVLSTLIRKTEKIREELGSLSQVLDPRISALFDKGIDIRKVDKLSSEINEMEIDKLYKEKIEAELEIARDKRKEKVKERIEFMSKLLEKSKKWLSMEDHYLKSALDCSLKLSQLPILQENKNGLAIPNITEVLKDPSWQATLDTLRPPKKRDQKPSEWRATTTFRPIVFHDNEKSSEDSVHLHLEHRLVKRLLNKFSAQGFVKDGLSRVCVIPCNVIRPRAVLLTRLLFFSKNGAGRLHEEIIPISAEWKTKKDRSSGLIIFNEKGEETSIKYLQKALLQDEFNKVDIEVIKKYVVEDFEELSKEIKDRIADRWVDVASKLKLRAEEEASTLKKLLEDQANRIRRDLDEPEMMQLGFNFEELKPREKQQVELDKKAKQEKLERLKVEIKEEPEKVKKIYEFHDPRVEKIGMVYLWPEGGV